MKLLAHRGWWDAAHAKNSPAALDRALRHGLGVETDVRDLNGRLVISHDPATEGAHTDLDEFLAGCGMAGLLALNIKADGLQTMLADALARHGVREWFAFDMSIPDTLHWRRRGLPYAVRLSEYESGGPLLAGAPVVWLDAFHSEHWLEGTLLRELLAQRKTVAVVSPELHGRPHEAAWQRLKALDDGSGRLHLCTDHVAQALEFFDA